MTACLGIDTSNYTTSAALSCGGRILKQEKKLLAVPAGNRGLRQSDAVFQHTVNLPEVLEALGSYDVRAVGVSERPRDVEGSYMPCFLAGISAASAVAYQNGVPLMRFSHQAGHLAAALYSCGREDLHHGSYLAFHASGGTTEILRVDRTVVTLLGGTKDISVGQVIDRVGVTLGLPFPCGRHLEEMAGDPYAVSPGTVSVKGFTCNLSGLENQAAEKKKAGMPYGEIAAFVLRQVSAVLEKLAENLRDAYPGLPIVMAGGVMSNRAIRSRMEERFGALVAEPAFSSDNAAGIARLTELAAEGALPFENRKG